MTAPDDRIDLVRAAHLAAELTYARLLLRGDVSSARRVSAANARAEGLAEAVGILTGVDVVDVRAKVRTELEAGRAHGLAGVVGARAELGAQR